MAAVVPEPATLRGARARAARWTSAIVFAVAVSTLAGGERLLSRVSPQQCAYLRHTGRPCLGCGGTRAFGYAARGRFAVAAGVNLLGAFAGVAVWMAAVSAAGAFATGRAVLLKAWLVLVAAVAPLAFVASALKWWYTSPPYLLHG